MTGTALQIALAAVCLLWAGMVLGISFLATPVKFMAPSITLLIGLDEGRYVFGAFHKAQFVLALIALGLLLRLRPGRRVCIALAAVGVALLLQTLWLWPLMDQRVTLLLAGQTPPTAPYHVFFVVLEMVKLAALIFAGVAALADRGTLG